MRDNYYISHMSYKDTYCNNCQKVTERYSSGHCKICVRKRSKVFNDIRNSKYNKEEILHKNHNKIRKPDFSKEAYSRLTIESVIEDFSNQKYYFIYFLLKDNKVVYVGQSNKNVLDRINNHLKDKVFDEVYYKSFSVENVMDEYEKKFIMKYRPKFNKEVIHEGIKYAFFDLKTEEVIHWTINEAMHNTGCSKSTVLGLLGGHRKSLYKRYVLEANKPQHTNFRNVLDTHTGIISRHNYITFAEMVGVSQNKVWYFMNGLNKSFLKKRYVLTD